jgi:hypothetical protein
MNIKLVLEISRGCCNIHVHKKMPIPRQLRRPPMVLRLKVSIGGRRILILLRIDAVDMISILLKIMDGNEGGGGGGDEDDEGWW